MKQKTTTKSFQMSGIGLHSGQESSLIISPAPVNSGVYFLKAGQKISAKIENVKETKRGTFLNGIAVTEHLLAAIYALGIDNLQIEVDGPELPNMDGSALPFVEALEKAGFKEQAAFKDPAIIKQPVKLIAGESSLELLPYHGFKVDFMVNFPSIGAQSYCFILESDRFKKEVAPARTFGYIEEYEQLKQQGLAQGASLENAVVLGNEGYLTPPRFTDELVRHKILDLIGDFALLGRPLQAEVRANKSGHKLNIELIRLLSTKLK